MNNKSIKRRLSFLESATPPRDCEHEYKKVIEWREDEITEKYYRDGEPITRREWLKYASGKPDIKVNWGDNDTI